MLMDTIADPYREGNASCDPPSDPSSDESSENDARHAGDDRWLESEDAEQIEAALRSVDPKPRTERRDTKVALAGAIILHISFIVAAAIMVARISTPARWRTQRGDPTAEAGGSGADVPQPADNQDFDRSLTSPPPISSSRTAAHPPSISQESDDSSALPDPLVLLPPAPIDPMIGIRSSQSAQPVPRFASTQPLASISHDKARPGAAGGSTLATGTTTPPRVASSGGGQRGNRDGFDSRGLPIPDYPTESRRRGEEGMVVVDVEVLPNGSVGSIRVVSDAGHPRLGTAAVEKLKFAAFEPAREDGRAVVGHILIPYRFTLD